VDGKSGISLINREAINIPMESGAFLDYHWQNVKDLH